MNNLIRFAARTPSLAGCRILATSSRFASTKSPSTTHKNEDLLKNFDPENYYFPPRLMNMNDTMEPYGSWKVAYAAEKRYGNKILLQGIIAFATGVFVFLVSPATDGIYMPNLDNIMAETTPHNEDVDLTDRKTVK